ncbi:hypothetical protein AAG906_018813 [Vitis piasezkii]
MNGIICLLAMGLIVKLLPSACQMVMTTLQRVKMVKENRTHQKSTSYLPYNAISLCYRR